MALEKFSIKTANGEALVSLAMDFNKPASFDLPPPEMAKQVLSQLDAKLSIDKAVIGDGVRVQAALAGETDQKAIDEQANMFTEMGSGMALSTEMIVLKGDKLESTLHYANNEVTFNDQKMSVEEFAMLVMSRPAAWAAAWVRNSLKATCRTKSSQTLARSMKKLRKKCRKKRPQNNKAQAQ